MADSIQFSNEKRGFLLLKIIKISEHQFTSFTAKLLLLIAAILVVSAALTMFLTGREVKNIVHEKSVEESKNQIRIMRLGIENEYRSIVYHREYALERYKIQLKNLLAILVSHLDTLSELSRKGILSEQQAKSIAADSIKKMQYGDKDYFLVYDAQGVVIAHPDKSIIGKNRSEFVDSRGNHVVKSFLDIAKNKGAGFYSYWFPRRGEKTPVEKLCYIELYGKWNWVIGTGLYIDDIEHDSRQRLDQVIAEMNDTFEKIRIGKSGYFFLFNDKKELLIHPVLTGQVSSGKGAAGGPANYLDQFMKASSNPDKPVIYLGNKPPDHEKEYGFWKESYVSYFKPLGWYIVSSVYRDEMEEPAQRIIRWQAIINVTILAISIIIGIIILRKMTHRLKMLTSYAQQLSSTDFIPLQETGSAIGIIAAKSKDEIASLARAFASMIQSLIDYIERLKATTAAKEKMESELRVAHDIQMNILPQKFPPFPARNDFDIFAFIKPAKEVGGDLYDFFAIDQEHILFVIADVSGKGIPAALFMAVTKTLIKSKAVPGIAPDSILTQVNQELYQGNDANMFVTVFCGILNTATGDIVYANGGHNPPLVIRNNGGTTFLKGASNLLVGILPDIQYSKETLTLEPGDSLFLYTDGVTEAMNQSGELFSDARLKEEIEKVSRNPIRELVSHIDEQVRRFSHDAPQSDDIAMLIVQYKG